MKVPTPGAKQSDPHIVVLSSLFPSSHQPSAGLFIRERMSRVGRRLPVVVVSPQPWFPLQGLLRYWRPGFRPGAPRTEAQSELDVYYPRYPSVPGLLKSLDGWSMAASAWHRLRTLKRQGRLDVLDAHFGYPDGFAAVHLARWLDVPCTITMRGTEVRHANDPALRRLLKRALLGADRVFAVSESLRQVALGLGVPAEAVRVVGNGVDLDKFRPMDKHEARRALGLHPEAKVLISVGGLCERKGFHRVIDCMPSLLASTPDLHFLIVGGPSAEGDWTPRLHRQVDDLGLSDRVHFVGTVAPHDLHRVLSAADVFVLATRNEGWANVFLEAMACGLPVVTTAVGGNAEVVCEPGLGIVVSFGDSQALTDALRSALARSWDPIAIRRHAQANTWDRRVEVLEAEFRALHGASQRRGGSGKPRIASAD